MTKLELYYRPPNRAKHILITDALDELYKKLDEIEKNIENSSISCDLTQKPSLFSRFIKKWL
jgi:hypothetical protein